MKPKIRSVDPILTVEDVAATVDWYEKNLGATNVWKYGDPVVHAGCSLGASQIQFSQEPKSMEGFELFLFVANIPEYLKEVREHGVEIAEELEEKPWGSTEFVVLDPNGVRLRFAEFRNKPKKQEELADVTFVERKLTPSEHSAMFESVGWNGFYNETMTAESLSQRMLVTIVAEHGSEVIGAASITGNGFDAFLVRDVMVVPAFQGRNVGRGLMQKLTEWARTNVPDGGHVFLQTGSGTTEFYEEFGFVNPDKGFITMYLSP